MVCAQLNEKEDLDFHSASRTLFSSFEMEGATPREAASMVMSYIRLLLLVVRCLDYNGRRSNILGTLSHRAEWGR